MLLLLSAAIGCGPLPAAPSGPQELYELGPLAPLAWLVGDWRSEAGRWHWIGAGDKVYGVAFENRGQGFRVMVIEDEHQAGRAQGGMRLQVYDGPESFRGTRDRLEAKLAGFRQGTAEDPPFEVALSRGDDGLQISTRRGAAQGALGPPEVSRLRSYDGEGAPELEEVDRALVEIVNDREHGSISSGAYWAAAFVPDGTYWCEGCAAGAPGRDSDAKLVPRNESGTFDWVPIASRRADHLGFTVGHMSYRPLTHPGVWRGTYVTIWERKGNGRWGILFHTRRSALAALPEPES